MTTMGRSVRVGFVALLAICCLQDVASYNPYAYNPSYFPQINSDSYSSMGDINWAKRGRQSTLQSLLEPDAYSSMGDINWAKRSRSGTLRSLLDQNYGYASMADANWGWKKRSDDKELKQKRFRDFSSMADADWGWGFGPNLKRGPRITKRFRDFGSMADAEWGWGFGPILKRDDQKSKSADYQSVPDVEALSTPKRGIQRSYKYRQPYMRARPRADRIQPYQAYARYGAISRPQTRKLGNRQYAFYSMADAPWGWKKSPQSTLQSLLYPEAYSSEGMADSNWGGGYGSPNIKTRTKRSELPALQDLNEENEGTNPMEEELEKRNVASMARSNMFPRKLRSYDEMRAGDENNLDLIEEKEEDTSNH